MSMTRQQRVTCAVVCAVWLVLAAVRIVSGTGGPVAVIAAWGSGISSGLGLVFLAAGMVRDRNR